MLKRPAALILFLLAAAVGAGQETVLQSRSELVLVPVSIADRSGRPVRDLTERDVILYDNNVPRRIQMEDVALPLSLAIAIQTTPSAQIVLDKLRRETGLIGPMLTGNGGEAAVIAFGREIRVAQPFTANEDEVANAIRRLDGDGEKASIADAVVAALNLLAARPVSRRRVLLLISEKHDTGSGMAALQNAAALAQRQNVTVYSVAFSPTKSVWTNKVPTYCKPTGLRTKCKICFCGNCGNQCDRADGKPQPFVPNQAAYSANLMNLIGAMVKASQANAGEVLAKFTGGAQTEFATRTGLDEALERISQDLHGQYLLSLTPEGAAPGEYRTLRVEVKSRPDLTVRSRPGYSVTGK